MRRTKWLSGLLFLLGAASPRGALAEGRDAGPAFSCAEGVATYYAEFFRGRRTASGRLHRPEALTAAHPSLPLGARVHVSNIENGRAVVVVVNDRCRCRRRTPHIDLSRAAAKKLGFLRQGTARVQMRPLARGQTEPDLSSCPGPPAGGATLGAEPRAQGAGPVL